VFEGGEKGVEGEAPVLRAKGSSLSGATSWVERQGGVRRASAPLVGSKRGAKYGVSHGVEGGDPFGDVFRDASPSPGSGEDGFGDRVEGLAYVP